MLGWSLRKEKVRIREMRSEDVEEARKIAQDSWSDMATRDVGRRIIYPMRSKKIIEAYVWKEPHGCFVADVCGGIVGAAYSHAWGRMGWVGPIEVLPEFQNRGIGRALLSECENFLRSSGCEVIGVETMSHIPKNLHFYLSQGYRPDALTLIAEKPTLGKQSLELREDEKIEEVRKDPMILKEAVLTIGSKIFTGLDPFKDIKMIVEKKLGSIFVWRMGRRILGFALLHTYLKEEEGDYASIRLILVDPDHFESEKGFDALLRACENESFISGKKRVFARFPVVNSLIYKKMATNGYVIKGANIRMFKGHSFSQKGDYFVLSLAG
ncbi:MAG: GNAT family N-acetyltransferase [Methanomassiliicoccales archaeon]|jgi:GNAT superfamily N-acetyltransferase|nr:GNAT family N-acetyltransferase [Methanomassiliicoccales archaeon]